MPADPPLTRPPDLATLARLLPGGVYQFLLSTDGSAHMPYVSETFADLVGIDAEDLQSDATVGLQRIPEPAFEAFWQSVQASAESLTRWSRTVRVPHPTRGERWLAAEAMPQRLPDGSTLWTGYLTDVTVRERERQQVRELTERLRLATKASHVGVWEYRISTSTLILDAQSRENLHLPDGAGDPTTTWRRHTRPEHVEALEAAALALIERNVPLDVEFPIFPPQQPNGRWLHTTASVIRDHNGAPTRLIGLVADATSRKQAEQQRQTALDRLNHFFSISLDLLAILDPDGRFLQVSRTWQELLGYRIDEIEGWPIFDFLAPADVSAAHGVLAELLTNTSTRASNIRFRTKDGRTRFLELRAHYVDGLIYAAAQDATERRVQEQALRDSQARFASIVDSQQELICRFKPDTTLTFANRAYLAAFAPDGSEASVLGVPWISRVNDPERDAIVARLHRLGPDLPAIDYEVRVRLASGRTAIMQCSDRAFWDDDGHVIEYQCVGHDVTALRTAQQDLESRERRLRAYLNRSPLGILVGRGQEIVETNPALLRILSKQPADIMSAGLDALVDPVDAARVLEALAELSVAGEARFTARAPTGKGGSRWLRINLAQLDDNEWVGFLEDTTQAEELRVALQRAESLRRRTNEVARVGGWEVALPSRRVSWTEVTRELHGVPDDFTPTLSGMLAFFEPGDSRRQISEYFNRTLATGEPWRYEAVLITATGQRRWVRIVCDADSVDGVVTRVYGSIQDIDALKIAQHRQHDAMRRAEDANRAKSTFLATMSHEIRTPMNGILAMAELLLDGALSPIQQEQAATILRSAEHLLVVINDILDFSRIESGRLAVQEVRFDLHRLVYDAVEPFIPQLTQREVELAVHIDGSVPQKFRGDPDRVRQILNNLIGNAVKFTTQGHVLVSVTYDDDSLRISVTDTGIGIPGAELERLFEPFEQVDATTARRFGGSGLGLAISRRLAKLLGGDIAVQSRAGRGSTFVLHLPAEPAEDTTSERPSLLHQRVLLLDDLKPSLIGIAAQLRRAGARVDAVDNVTSALELLAAHSYDLVLLDSAGPVDFHRSERIAQACPHTTRIALRPPYALRTPTDPNVHGEVAKPVRDDALVLALLQAKHPLPSVAHKPASSPSRLSGADILVVEDHVVNQRVIRMLLQQLGAKVKVVGDGEAALRLFEQARPELVLMDVHMPGMDGFQVTQRMRAMEHPSRPSVPIVALTANAMPGTRERCLDAGMTDYLSKPIHKAELSAMLLRYLSP